MQDLLKQRTQLLHRVVDVAVHPAPEKPQKEAVEGVAEDVGDCLQPLLGDVPPGGLLADIADDEVVRPPEDVLLQPVPGQGVINVDDAPFVVAAGMEERLDLVLPSDVPAGAVVWLQGAEDPVIQQGEDVRIVVVKGVPADAALADQRGDGDLLKVKVDMEVPPPGPYIDTVLL